MSLRKLSKQAKHVNVILIDPGESWTSVQTLLSDLHALRIVEFFAHYSRKFKIIICLTLCLFSMVCPLIDQRHCLVA